MTFRGIKHVSNNRSSPLRNRRLNLDLLDRLESRVLLSGSLYQSQMLSWKGHDVEVAAGRWVVQIDKITGKRDAQLKSAEKVAQAAGSAVHAKQQLGADGLFLFTLPSN